MSDEIKVKLGAETSDLESGMHKGAEIVKESLEKMHGGFEKLAEGIGHVTVLFVALGAALAGGEMFKESIASVIEEAETVNKLSIQLGITLEKASELNMTLSLLGISTESYMGAVQGTTKSLKTNEDLFTQNGIAIKNSKGELLDSQQVMTNTVAFLGGIKDGTERNIAAMSLMGRGWKELSDLQRINAETTERGTKFAREMGQVLGEENIESMHKYNEAMNGSKEVSEALMQIIGEAVIPAMTKLGEWFMDIGPSAARMFGEAVNVLVAVFEGLWDIVVSVWQLFVTAFSVIKDVFVGAFGEMGGKAISFSELFHNTMAVVVGVVQIVKVAILLFVEAVKIGFDELVAAVMMFDNVMNRVLHLDFTGAKAAFLEGTKNIQQIAQDHAAKIVSILNEGKAKFDEALFGKDSGSSEKGGPEKTGHFKPIVPPGPKGKEQNRLAEFEGELNAQKQHNEDMNAANGTFYEFSKAAELAFWENIKATKTLNQKELLGVEKKITEDKIALNKERYNHEMEDLKISHDSALKGSVERIAIIGQEANLVKAKFGEMSPEYRKVMAEMTAAAKEHQAQTDALAGLQIDRAKEHNLAMLDLEKEVLAQKLAMGDISEVEELTALKVLEEKKYQVELQAAQDKLALMDEDLVKQQEANDKILAMAEKHKQDMLKIDTSIMQANKSEWDKFSDPVKNAFSKSVDGIIQGTLTLHNAMRQMAQSIVLEFVNMGTKIVVDWVSKEAMRTFATVAGTQERVGAEASGAAQSMAISGASASKGILNDAYEAMAGAYKAIAGIPFVGPFMAPVVAAGAFAAVAGLAGSVMSAEGGYDIPAGINPMTQLHEKEMVLPAKQADAVRSMAEGGGSAGGSTHIHINAIDAKSVTELFRNNPNILAPALNRAKRNFSATTPKNSPLARF